ncbi:MAG: CPBP family intramembrane metalloprotease [Candidatus Lokiarchaeota archaeon]|nr:CPBP family intramembrane metalloprotease [Candidatus Lokiarchaeota archaeon]
MIFDPISLFYFLIITPIVVVSYLLIYKFNKKLEAYQKIIFLGIFLFLVRFFLIFFQDSIGIMPYILPNVIFYALLAVFGVFLTILYVKKIEKLSFKEIGWELKDIKKTIIYTLISFGILLLILPLIVFLAEIRISILVSWEKITIGICFGIFLGGFYEETMFRGIIQKEFNSIFDDLKSILFTSVVFVLTHLGYLPFTGFGIFYIYIFIMAILLSILRYKTNQFACFIVHGGLVFILIIFV